MSSFFCTHPTYLSIGSQGTQHAQAFLDPLDVSNSACKYTVKYCSLRLSLLCILGLCTLGSYT